MKKYTKIQQGLKKGDLGMKYQYIVGLLLFYTTSTTWSMHSLKQIRPLILGRYTKKIDGNVVYTIKKVPLHDASIIDFKADEKWLKKFKKYLRRIAYAQERKREKEQIERKLKEL